MATVAFTGQGVRTSLSWWFVVRPPPVMGVLTVSMEAWLGVWGSVAVQGLCVCDGMAKPPVWCVGGSRKLPWKLSWWGPASAAVSPCTGSS